MNIGVSQLDITPNRPIDLSGFASRTQPSTGVLDPLFVKCLFLQDGDEQLLWLHADLVAFAPEFVRAFRAWAHATLRIDPNHIVLSATHTHSAPAPMTLIGCGQMDEHYLRDLMSNCQNATQAAVSKTTPCTVSAGCRHLDLAIDRRKKPTSHTDPNVYVLQFHNSNGDTLAVLANYTMHPVALGHVNRQVSADWCGAASAAISDAFPTHPIVLMTNGAAGNINPPAESVPPQQVYDYGRSVADSALHAMHSSSYKASSLLVTSQTVPIWLDAADEPAIDHITKHYLATVEPGSLWEKPFRAALLNWNKCRKQDLAAGVRSIDIQLQVIRLGPSLFIVTVNGEMFSRFTQIVRDKTNQPLFTVAYANEAFGYIPTDAAYDEGGYEVETAHFFYNSFRPKRGSLELLADRAAELIIQSSHS